jgi:hypothetical protein
VVGLLVGERDQRQLLVPVKLATTRAAHEQNLQPPE